MQASVNHFSRSQAPAWEHICRPKPCFGLFYEKPGLLCKYVPKQGLGNEKIKKMLDRLIEVYYEPFFI
jgi:hypothetical protein